MQDKASNNQTANINEKNDEEGQWLQKIENGAPADGDDNRREGVSPEVEVLTGAGVTICKIAKPVKG